MISKESKKMMSRRTFISASGLSVLGVAVATKTAVATSIGEHSQSWSKIPGSGMTGYGMPSPFESNIARTIMKPYGEVAYSSGVSLTPLHLLRGTITPNGLHFERHHSGIPDIDPSLHTLSIHGLVERPLKFTLKQLLRYPNVTKTTFIECAGNSWPNSKYPTPNNNFNCGMIHGLISCSEWTGIPLKILLKEAGIKSNAKWVIAEGADSARMNRSIPLDKIMDDAILALYQNGEPIRPEQGYPMRVVLPGYEGNMQIKWLHQLYVTDAPAETKEETSKYTDLLPNGKALQYTFEMGVKSVITSPSAGLVMEGAGVYEISGIAWTGHGHIKQVEVSIDGGETWSNAVLQEPVLDHSLTRFSISLDWDGSDIVLQSRALDNKGNAQPTREQWKKQYSPENIYHYNAIQSWKIDSKGVVSNVYS